MKPIPHKLKTTALSIYCFFIVLTVTAQNVVIVPNQPSNRYFNHAIFEHSSEAIIQYLNTIFGGRNFYTFDGTTIASMELPTNKSHYLASLGDYAFFCSFENNEILYRYAYTDRSITTIDLPAGYSFFQHIATYEDKLYFFLTDAISGKHVVHYYDNEMVVAVPNPGDLSPTRFLRQLTTKLCFLFDNESGESFVYAYDGTGYEFVPTPSGKKFANIPSQPEENGSLFIAYANLIGKQTLYIYDGTNLQAIGTPANTNFAKVIGRGAQTDYLSYKNSVTGVPSVYTYSENVLTKLEDQTGYSVFSWLGEFSGQAYFVYRKLVNGNREVFRYDGTQLQGITQPDDLTVAGAMGVLGDKVYVLYNSTNGGDNQVGALQQGMNEIAIINAIPTDRVPTLNWFHWDNRLYWGLNNVNNDSEDILYAFDGNNFKELENPTGVRYEQFAFAYQEEPYLLYLTESNERVLYKLKDDLTIVTAQQKGEAKIQLQAFPNPMTADVQVQLKSQAKIKSVSFVLSSSLGQVIQTQRAESVGQIYEVYFSTAQLPKGMYFITANTDLGTFTKRLLKE